MTKQKRVLVTGAGGFIGHHLVQYLVARLDVYPGYRQTDADVTPLREVTAATGRVCST